MSLSCSGEQKEQFENSFEVLAQLEFEISLKNHAQSNFSGCVVDWVTPPLPIDSSLGKWFAPGRQRNCQLCQDNH